MTEQNVPGDRERKLRAMNTAIWALLLGLIITLISARNALIASAAGVIYGAFAGAVVSVLIAFVTGNVKVHGIQNTVGSVATKTVENVKSKMTEQLSK